MTRRIAVLVDGDNISPVHSPRIMAEAAKLGRVDLARVYGNASRPSDWLTTPGFRMIHAGCGKNAADVLLCIDAMELALTGDWAGFVIASSDGDFVHLAQRLRERGLEVLGIGEAKASAGFRGACATFTIISHAASSVDNAIAKMAVQSVNTPLASAFDHKIKAMVEKHSREGRGMKLSALSNAMKIAHQTQISAFSESSWRGYLTKRPRLYDLDPRGPDAMVRFLRDGFGTSPVALNLAAE